jgi:tetratricopeptide (TPR) repeat protein
MAKLDKRREAETEYKAALEEFRRLTGEQPRIPEYRQHLGFNHNSLGNLLANQGRGKEAEPEYVAAIEEYRRLVKDSPKNPEDYNGLSNSLDSFGTLLIHLGRSEEAEACLSEAVSIHKQLVTNFPKIAQYRHSLANHHNSLGVLLTSLRKLDQAENSYRDARKEAEQLVLKQPDVPDYHNLLAGILVNMALLRLWNDDAHGARILLEQAHPHHDAALKANPRNWGYRSYYASNLGYLAKALVILREPDQATKLVEKLRAGVSEPKRDLLTAAETLCYFVRAAENDKKVPEAERKKLANGYADQAMDLLHQMVEAGGNDLAKLKGEDDLKPLRGREDFKKLIADLEAKQKPAGSPPATVPIPKKVP